MNSDTKSQETPPSRLFTTKVRRRRSTPSIATPSLEKISEESKEESESYFPGVWQENRATRSSRPAQVLNIPRIRPHSQTTNTQEEPIPVPEKPSPRVVQSRFTEDLDDVFIDDDQKVLASKNTNAQTNDGTRKSSEGWLSGGKRLGYNYDFVPKGKAQMSSAKQDLPRGQSGQIISSSSSEASLNLAEEPLNLLEAEPSNASGNIHASTLKSLENTTKSAALIPRLSGFMRRKVKQLSGTDSNLADDMVVETGGLKTCKDNHSQFLNEKEDEFSHGTKGRPFFKTWKNPMSSSRCAFAQASRINPNVVPFEGVKETTPDESNIKDSEDFNTSTALSSVAESQLYNESLPQSLTEPDQQTFSMDGPATAPVEIPSAEDWSRMYQAYVLHPTADDEVRSMSSHVSNVDQYARTIRGNYGGSGSSGISTRAQYGRTIPEDHMGPADFNEPTQHERTAIDAMKGKTSSNSTDLRESTTEFRQAQLAAEIATREELIQKVNNT